MEKFLKRSTWTDIIISILFILFGIMLIVRAETIMSVISILLGGICIIMGILKGIDYFASGKTDNYSLAIAIIAALDSVFGGIASSIKKNFDLKVFISGFFVNAIIAMLLTYLGQRLNVDIYLAAIIVFVGRMFNNLGIIRRYYLSKVTNKIKKK